MFPRFPSASQARQRSTKRSPWLLAILRYSRCKPPYPVIHGDDHNHKRKTAQDHRYRGEAIANHRERRFPAAANDQSGEKDSDKLSPTINPEASRTPSRFAIAPYGLSATQRS